MKNNFNLYKLLGILLLCLGAAMLVGFTAILFDSYNRNPARLNRVLFQDGLFFFILFGFLYFVSGLLMINRASFSRNFVSIVLGLNLMIWAYYFFEEFGYPDKIRNGMLIVIGMFIFSISVFVNLVLLINNEKVISHIDSDPNDIEMHEDILDVY